MGVYNSCAEAVIANGSVKGVCTTDDNWSGLKEYEEWKNGDDLVFGENNRKGIYIAYDTYNVGHVVYSRGDYFYVLDGDFRKPETAEQREERERLEAAYDLYLDICEHTRYSPSKIDEVNLSFYLRIVDKTGYRKNAGSNQ